MENFWGFRSDAFGGENALVASLQIGNRENRYEREL